MKTRNIILRVILIFAVLVLLISCATGKKAYVARENEEIYGTWVNTSYGTTKDFFPQKRIINPDGTLEEYGGMADIAHFPGKYTIIDKWTDSEGNIWYKLITEYGGKTYGAKPFYELHKISNSGLTWEFVSSTEAYPTEIDPDHPMYFIYYRQ